MRQRKFLILAVIAAFYSCNPMEKQTVDLILLNGKVYTVDAAFTQAEAFAVKDGRFVAVGSNADIEKAYTSSQYYDAGGQAVYPGLIDGHCHFYGYGENLFRYADLFGTQSFEEVIQRLEQHAASHPSDWILGRGWDHNLWNPQMFPENSLLEKHFPGKKIYLGRVDGHAALVSKAALELAGIQATTKVQGGEVLLSDSGQPTGMLIDNASDAVKSLIPKLTDSEKEAAMLEAQKNCFAVGLTSVVDAGLPYPTIELIRKMQTEGRLTMRINSMIDPDDATMDYYMPHGPFTSDNLTIRSVKLYADGALGSRGAKMKAPYCDDPEKTGLILFDTAFYKNVMQKAYNAGFQVNMHAIGDEAVRFVLDLYGEFLKGKNDRRWRIEHAQIVDPADFELFGKYNIIPSIQSTHATSDMGWAQERVGPERIKGAYAQKQLLEQNGWLVNGTDFPIENINPLLTYYAAVFRKDLQGLPENGFQPENALSREEALRSITIWAAKGSFEEAIKGSIEPQKLADFVVLDHDLSTATEKEVLSTKPIAVFMSGKKVFQAE